MSTRTRGVPPIVSSTLLALGVALTVLGVVLMEARHSRLTPEGLSRRAGFVAVLFVLGVVCAAGGYALARDRRRALLDTSVHLIAAGVVLLVLKAAGGWFLQSGGSEPLSREAIAGVWAAFTAGIRGWALTLSLVGLVTAATALLAWGAFAMMRPAPPSEAVAAGVCNGSAALCDRPLNQVTFPGTHNAIGACIFATVSVSLAPNRWARGLRPWPTSSYSTRMKSWSS